MPPTTQIATNSSQSLGTPTQFAMASRLATMRIAISGGRCWERVARSKPKATPEDCCRCSKNNCIKDATKRYTQTINKAIAQNPH